MGFLVKFFGIPGSCVLAVLIALAGYTGVRELQWRVHKANDAVKEASQAMAERALHKQFEERVSVINNNVADYIAKKVEREEELTRTIADLRAEVPPGLSGHYTSHFAAKAAIAAWLAENGKEVEVTEPKLDEQAEKAKRGRLTAPWVASPPTSTPKF